LFEQTYERHLCFKHGRMGPYSSDFANQDLTNQLVPVFQGGKLSIDFGCESTLSELDIGSH